METDVAILGEWIATYSGRQMTPLDPNPEDIYIEDVAHALSQQCRFTGHTSKFYSVAEHSVRVSELVNKENALAGLLHDASEAYLSDFASPIKRAAGFGEIYREVEERLMEAVAIRFNIEWPMADQVKWADKVLLRGEQRDLMKLGWQDDIDSYEQTIVPWTPEEAEVRFLDRYELLTKDPVEYII